jgi:CRP/FNR family transcriptional regulator, cyclic AMP receptor protein
MADFTDTLGRVPLFAGLPRRELERVAQNMAERSFSAGETIVSEGESGVGFFVIEEGTATVTVGGQTVNTLGPGDYFGEIALIDRGPRSASVSASTDLRCRGMTAWEFRPMVQENSEMAWPLLEALVKRLRATERATSS